MASQQFGKTLLLYGHYACSRQAPVSIMMRIGVARNSTNVAAMRPSDDVDNGRNRLRFLLDATSTRTAKTRWPAVRSSSSVTSSTLGEQIRKAYNTSETDGILALAAQIPFDESTCTIFSSILEASDGKSGTAASIINAWIASCSLVADKWAGAAKALELLAEFDKLAIEQGIHPDLVTFSLAYNALCRHDEFVPNANGILQHAVQRSRKLAGSKRRKMRAASRHKKTTCRSFQDAENDLKGILGHDFSILLESDDFAVINKPSGVPFFHVRNTAAGKVRRKSSKSNRSKDASKTDVSLEDAFTAVNLQLSTLNHEAMGLVHRLDRGSSGCMIFAKTEEAHAKLLSSFYLRQTTKKYLAAVTLPPDNNFGDQEGAFNIDHPVGLRPARSTFRLIRRYGPRAGLFEVHIHTGRRHQIRIHAAECLDSPILLDDAYSSSHSSISNELKVAVETLRHDKDSSKLFMLHASSLSIPAMDVDVEAATPNWWNALSELCK